MSIPVQPDDSDMILQSPLDEIGRLLDRLEALERVASAARPFAPVNRLTDEDRIDNRDKLRRALAMLDGGVK